MPAIENGFDALLRESKIRKKQDYYKNPISMEYQFIECIDDFLISRNKELAKSALKKDKHFRPSSASKCNRELYYYFKGYMEEATDTPSFAMRILDLGTVLHEQIQMEYLNEISKQGGGIKVLGRESLDLPEGTELLDIDKSIEIGFYSSTLNMKGLIDGLLEFKGNKFMFEFKTINDRQFSKLTKPKEEHIQQATMYSLALGLNDIIFLYYNKNTSALKCYFISIEDKDRQDMLDKMDKVTEAVREGKIPEKEPLKCLYCRYKKQCNSEI